MVDSLPTGSITGQQDWEWNRMYADRRSRGTSRGRPAAEGRPDEQPVQSRQARSQWRAPPDSPTCRAALERKERRLQYVITHYERLLAEKNRRLEGDIDAGSGPDWSAAVLAPVRRFVARL